MTKLITPYTSLFSQQNIKHERTRGSSANLLTKILKPEVLYVCKRKSQTMGFVFRKARCLIRLSEDVRDIFVTISNANDNRVSSLEEATRNRRIENSTSLALHKVGFVVDSINLKKQQHIHSGGISRNGTAR
ncbi:hypothetical protein RclHR1_00020014 [Rhizophagus clarus]|uniref:Uncharacterized protein n=1 Tax=Rhizophagus clarus TaxID=94130 RepID=A0A2Z6R5S0_9GLOM|nr:hypothetical protein RclHR1_00020014 [Rhizophagus clarus]